MYVICWMRTQWKNSRILSQFLLDLLSEALEKILAENIGTNESDTENNKSNRSSTPPNAFKEFSESGKFFEFIRLSKA